MCMCAFVVYVYMHNALCTNLLVGNESKRARLAGTGASCALLFLVLLVAGKSFRSDMPRVG